jgi:hypothetical protein
VVLIQPEQRAQLTIIWRTRCHEKPTGPVTVRFWLPAESPATDSPVVSHRAGALELRQTPVPPNSGCEPPVAPPRLDVYSFWALDPPVTP